VRIIIFTVIRYHRTEERPVRTPTLPSYPRRLRAAAFAALALLTTLLAAQLPAQTPAKRPITHADYEIWNTATNLTLSPDGHWLAYNLLPAQGDGTVIVKQLSGPAEYKIARGGRPAPTTGEKEDTDQAPTPRARPAAATAASSGPSGSPQFSPDGTKLYFPLTPTKAELDAAQAQKKQPSEQPRPVLAVMDLATGAILERIPRVQSFAIHGEGTGYLVYKKQAQPQEPAPPAALGAIIGGPAARPATTAPQQAPAGEQPGAIRRGGFGQRGRPGTPTASPTTDTPPATAPRQQYGSELVVRDLANGRERTFDDVTDFTVSKDAKLLIYAVASRNEETNGVYAVQLDSQAGPLPLKSGKGRYTRLTWDEAQTKLAFFFDDSPPPSVAAAVAGGPSAQAPPAPPARPGTDTAPAPASPPSARLRVYLWERPTNGPMPMAVAASTLVSAEARFAPPAEEVLNPNTPGIKKGWLISDRGGLRFTADGAKLILATIPEPAPRTTAPTGPADERVELDLWHWKDEYIQPMQRVREAIERNRSYAAVYLLDSKEFRHLSDEDVAVSVPDFGDWAVASSDKPYLYLTGYGPSLRDYALVNIRSGERKELMKGHHSSVSASPKHGYLLTFDGQHWLCFATTDAKPVNLTEKLPVKFFNEDHDTPSEPGPYGSLGWTEDEQHVLLYDRYDIWKVAVDGSTAENLTKIGRGQNLRFRRIRLPDGRDEPERGIDLSKPMLLRAENLHTRDTGFYRLDPGTTPKLLVMGARNYGVPTKAKNADVLLMTVQTFNDYPDYYVTTPDFREIRRVTDINPRKAEFNWGTAELVHYKNLDGVELSGMLIKPEDFDPTKKYPMIVYIYERLSQNLHNFRLPSAGTSINPTYYASNGYLVFMPDIVYTIGSPGQSALKCVLPAIQAVADKGFVKEDAIGIQGHSWGGYQIAYMVTQTNRFKAAAAGAPVSNMVSAYGGIRWGSGLPREFQYERTQSRIGATLWQAPMKYIENSPVFMADRVTTPLLMLHNDQDDAVPWYQGIEYYLALRRLGKEVYLLNYNGELHGLRRKANQRDYTLRMQQFFDHHLKGEPMPEWMAQGVKYADRFKEKEQYKELFQPVKD
jgi:dipeptidyl aminopeptidase/acylaminoacyl peptidase